MALPLKVGGELDEWEVVYLLFDSDDYVVEKGFTSKYQAEKWAKSENLNELADEYEIIKKVNYAKGICTYQGGGNNKKK